MTKKTKHPSANKTAAAKRKVKTTTGAGEKASFSWRLKEGPPPTLVTETGEAVELPTIYQAVDHFQGKLTGIARECEIMPFNDHDTMKRLYASIRDHGVKKPIEVTPDWKLIGGRHRLIVCAALGIQPEFKDVAKAEALVHVISETAQRSNGSAARAAIALQLEHYMKMQLEMKPDSVKLSLRGGDKVKEDTTADLGNGQKVIVRAGETLRDAAIREAGATRSAVRRLVTIQNKEPALAERAASGEITLRDAEAMLSGSKKASAKTNGSAGRKSTPTSHSNGKATPAGKAGRSSLGRHITERTLSGGKKEFSDGSRSAILIPERSLNGKTAVRLLWDDGTKLTIRRYKSTERAEKEIQGLFERSAA